MATESKHKSDSELGHYLVLTLRMRKGVYASLETCLLPATSSLELELSSGIH